MRTAVRYAATFLLLLLAAARAAFPPFAPNRGPVCAIGSCAQPQHKYPHTLDCGAFNYAKGYRPPPGGACDAEGNWSAIMDRPVPEWLLDLKFGVFVHWGVYSVPAMSAGSTSSEWYWFGKQCREQDLARFHNATFGPNFTYPEFAPMFTAELFDAGEWVKLFKDAGARLILPVTKHFDGFSMWNATTTSPGWNAVEVGPKRDVITELYEATLAAGLRWGLYYAQPEFFHDDFVNDHNNNWTTRDFVERKMDPQRYELMRQYPETTLWHTDGGWFIPDTYLGNLKWLTWLLNESPMREFVATTNSMQCCRKLDPTGPCFAYGDAPAAGDREQAGKVSPQTYMNDMTLQRVSWGWDRAFASSGIDDFYTTAEVVQQLVSTTAWNGTLILNVGPNKDGTIAPIFQQRIKDVGAWLRINGRAIFDTRPWKGAFPTGTEPNSTSVFYTTRTRTTSSTFAKKTTEGGRSSENAEAEAGSSVVYCIFLAWPPVSSVTGTARLVLQRPTGTAATTAKLLSQGGDVPLKIAVAAEDVADEGGAGTGTAASSLVLELPPLTPELFAAPWGWAVELEGLKGA